MIKTIIIDDEYNAREFLEKLLTRYFPDKFLILDKCESVDQAILSIEKYNPELVFLDIQMPNKNGFQLFKELDKVKFEVIFTTAHSEFAIMPKLQADVLLNFQKDVDFYHSYYFIVGAEGTNKYVAPKVGLSLFGIVDLTGGYALPIADSKLNGKELKGLNINFTLNIPTVAIYDMFK